MNAVIISIYINLKIYLKCVGMIITDAEGFHFTCKSTSTLGFVTAHGIKMVLSLVLISISITFWISLELLYLSR